MSNAAALATIKEAEKELAQLDVVYNELLTDAGLTAASMAPPPVGTVADVVSIGRSLSQGDWGGALLDVVGIIPIVGDGIKGASKGTKIAAKMKDVKIALDTARAKLARKKQALMTDAKGQEAKTNKALKKCNVQPCPGGRGGGKKNKFPDAKEIELNSKGQFKDKNGNLRTNAGPNAPDIKKWKENGGTVKYDEATDTVIYGKTVKTAKGKEPVEVPYKKGPPDNKRYPDFSEYSEQQVNIKMTGKKEVDIEPPEGGDFSSAWKALEKQKGGDEVHKYGIKRRTGGKRTGVYQNKNPRGKTWHHVQDGKTMQLIDSSIHSSFTHKGGASLSQ
jgi:hypothetical protein